MSMRWQFKICRLIPLLLFTVNTPTMGMDFEENNKFVESAKYNDREEKIRFQPVIAEPQLNHVKNINLKLNAHDNVAAGSVSKFASALSLGAAPGHFPVKPGLPHYRQETTETNHKAPWHHFKSRTNKHEHKRKHQRHKIIHQNRNVEHSTEGRSIIHGMQNYNMKIRLSARHLPNLDSSGTSDPYVIFSYTDSDHKTTIPVGRTSVILNDENPAWGDVFGFKYDKTKHQIWNFAVYDKDTHGKDDFIGSVWVKAKYFVQHGEYLKLELSSDNDSVRDSDNHAPILIIQRD